MVSKYTGFNFYEVDELNVFEYWLYLRDAIIYEYSKSENGLEYLEKCWIMEQTTPDRTSLRNRFKNS